MKKLLLLLTVVLSCWLPTAHAVRLKSLYEIDIPVASQHPDLRTDAFHKALSQVLVKVSGNAAIIRNPNINARLDKAVSLIDEYSYTPSHLPSPAPPWLLKIIFDSASVDRLLRHANASLWSENRPLMIFWVTNSLSAEGVHIITSDTDDEMVTLFRQAANRRGLPVIFPLMDLSEMGHISMTDIGKNNFAILSNASKRYSSDAILAGQLFQDAGGYHFTATMQLRDDQLKWDVTGASMPSVISNMVDHIADTLATRYASVMSEQVHSEINMTVTNIAQSDDIDKLLQYLEHLSPVANIRILQISGQSVVLLITLHGTLSNLNQAILADQHLIPVTNQPEQPTPDNIWQWKG